MIVKDNNTIDLVLPEVQEVLDEVDDLVDFEVNDELM
jgi:hypothetical protein